MITDERVARLRFAARRKATHFESRMFNTELVSESCALPGQPTACRSHGHNPIMILALLTFISIGVVALVVRSLLPAYLGEKGKNLATKEDIAEITQRIEEVKTQHALVLEASTATHQLRLAAIDKRLQAHQEAFELWREMMTVAHQEADLTGPTVMKCQAWWNRNCLYLEPKARDAFSLAYSSIGHHRGLVVSRADVETIKSNWLNIIGSAACAALHFARDSAGWRSAPAGVDPDLGGAGKTGPAGSEGGTRQRAVAADSARKGSTDCRREDSARQTFGLH